MQWADEARRLGAARRTNIARLVLAHRLAVRDPLSAAPEDDRLQDAVIDAWPVEEAG